MQCSYLNEAVCEATTQRSIQFIDLDLCSQPTARSRALVVWKQFVCQICARNRLRPRSQASHGIQVRRPWWGFGGCEVGTAHGISSWPYAHLINDSAVIGERARKISSGSCFALTKYATIAPRRLGIHQQQPERRKLSFIQSILKHDYNVHVKVKSRTNRQRILAAIFGSGYLTELPRIPTCRRTCCSSR